MKNTITDFCRETSLHGWKFLATNKLLSFNCFFWTATIVSALSLGLVLITWNTEEFMKATVDFTTLSMTTSMNEVFFPAIYIINKNFIRKSIANNFFKNQNSGKILFFCKAYQHMLGLCFPYSDNRTFRMKSSIRGGLRLQFTALSL